MGPVPSTHSPISGQLHRRFLLPSNLIVFALQREYEGDPFLDLYTYISHLSTLQEIILLGGFNAHTKCLQVPFHNKFEDVLCLRELQLESIGLHRNSHENCGSPFAPPSLLTCKYTTLITPQIQPYKWNSNKKHIINYSIYTNLSSNNKHIIIIINHKYST